MYAGAALAAATLPLARFRPSAAVLWIHGAAMIQMLVLGFNPFEEPAWLRTLSGAAFSAGAVYFLWLPLRGRLWPEGRGRAGPYFAAAAGALALLQVFVRIDSRAAGITVEGLALAGVASMVLLVLTAAGVGLVQLRARRNGPA